MSTNVEALLGVQKDKAAQAMSTDECLRVIAEEAKAQTRQLKAIRFLLSIAWLLLLLGGIRVYFAR